MRGGSDFECLVSILAFRGDRACHPSEEVRQAVDERGILQVPCAGLSPHQRLPTVDDMLAPVEDQLTYPRPISVDGRHAAATLRASCQGLRERSCVRWRRIVGLQPIGPDLGRAASSLSPG